MCSTSGLCADTLHISSLPTLSHVWAPRLKTDYSSTRVGLPFCSLLFNVCFVLGSHEPQTGLELAVWLRLTLLTLLCFILFWRQLLYVALAVLKLIQ